MNGFAYLLLATLGVFSGGWEERVDRLEINHYRAKQGQTGFVQAIGWDWDGINQRYCVQWWGVIDNEDKHHSPLQQPSGKIKVRLHVNRVGHFTVLCDEYIETYSNFDPELLDREWYHLDLRRGFAGKFWHD